jgi:decaprenyl-phosphate phosphoribosyltransferase
VRVPPLVAALRPSHWWKNVPVAAALVFGHKLRDSEAVASVVACVVAFCLVSSAGYLVNDVVDRDVDALHPRRRSRPVANGALSPRAALVAAAIFGATGLTLAACASTMFAFALTAVYAATTLAYTLVLRQVPGGGPAVVAGGFVLRLAAGAEAASVPPSPWLLSLTAVVALALAVGKKEAEARRLMGEAPLALRRLTDALLVISVVGYAAYTQWPTTVALHRTRALAWTVVPVAAALLRFRTRLRSDHSGAGPAELVARDPWLLGLGALWIATVIAILHRAE